MLHLLDRFRRQTSGNVAITFALMLIPIVGMVGAAIDYSNANRIRTWLIAAADAASVGAVVKSSAAMTAAAAMSGDGPIPVGATEAINIFNAQIAGKTGFKLSSVTAKVDKSKNAVTAKVQFSADVPTFVLGALGKKTFSIGSTSTAANGMPPFIDFYLLLDNTPSMGVAATPADIDKMVKNTPDQCAFACHNLDDPKNNYYQLAKKLGVTMRIDVLRQATEQLMDTAEATETIKNQFRMAIYTFASSCTSPGLTTIKALTSSLSSAKSAAKNIDLMTIPYQGYNNDQCTNFEDVMADVNKVIANPGSGASASSPQKYLFFVSDGVADFNNPGSCSQPTDSTGRCQEPIDLAVCTAIKSRGIKIAVLYTTYLPLPTNAYYNKWIAPFVKKIGPAMESCASPGLYFEVSPSEGISDAMNALFQKALAQARLTK
jgi:Flp pilus assembly protein TadG